MDLIGRDGLIGDGGQARCDARPRGIEQDASPAPEMVQPRWVSPRLGLSDLTCGSACLEHRLTANRIEVPCRAWRKILHARQDSRDREEPSREVEITSGSPCHHTGRALVS